MCILTYHWFLLLPPIDPYFHLKIFTYKISLPQYIEIFMHVIYVHIYIYIYIYIYISNHENNVPSRLSPYIANVYMQHIYIFYFFYAHICIQSREKLMRQEAKKSTKHGKDKMFWYLILLATMINFFFVERWLGTRVFLERRLSTRLYL